jgi:hypothetical protein
VSIFLLYFDDGPLHELAGNRSSLVLHPVPQVIRYAGAILTHQAISITDGLGSESLRDASTATGAAMRRDLALLVVDRLLRSYSPGLLFHRAQGEDAPIDASSRIRCAIVDLLVRAARVEAAGRSGPQGHTGGAAASVGHGAAAWTGAEGESGSLGDLLTQVPYDTLVTIGSPPRATAGPTSGRHNKRRR